MRVCVDIYESATKRHQFITATASTALELSEHLALPAWPPVAAPPPQHSRRVDFSSMEHSEPAFVWYDQAMLDEVRQSHIFFLLWWRNIVAQVTPWRRCWRGTRPATPSTDSSPSAIPSCLSTTSRAASSTRYLHLEHLEYVEHLEHFEYL